VFSELELTKVPMGGHGVASAQPETAYAICPVGLKAPHFRISLK
jgi:hypothetical protein